jgi:hypothetical protein
VSLPGICIIVCPSALFKLKGGVVVNTAVSIVVANTVAITIFLWFNTIHLQSVFISGLGNYIASILE